jgi:predicted RNA polymerase sigma factor
LLEKLGRVAEARVEFERALRLTTNAREREVLQSRVQALVIHATPRDDGEIH